jgi:hypothetical protein
MTMHPTDEQLAAFLEGRLEPAERAALVAHLDGCPRCLEWVSEIGMTLTESAVDVAVPISLPPTAANEPTARATSSHGTWWALLAASIALAIGLTFWPRPVAVDRLADALHGSANDLSSLTSRGAETGIVGFAGRPRPATAVLAGATELELEVARRAGDDLELHCLPLEALVERTLRCEDGRAVAATLDRMFGFEDLALGRWLAAARLAALTRDVRFFAAVEAPALEEVGGLRRAPLERAVLAGALTQLQGTPEPADFDTVARTIDELLAAL